MIGQWAEHHQQFNADVFDYFGYGIKRYRNEIHHGEVTFTRIESAEPVYETPDSTHLTGTTLHSAEEKKFERLVMAEDENITQTSNWDIDTYYNSHPYPGFYPWFVAGSIAVAVVLLAVVFNMVRIWSKKEEKKLYKLAASSA